MTDDRHRERRPSEPPSLPDDGPTDLSQAKDIIQDLEFALAEKNLELSSMTVRAAEAENALDDTRERVRRDAAKGAEQNRRAILRDFIEIMDNFDRALESEVFINGRNDAEASAVIDGVKLVRQSFLAKLAEHGVSRMHSDGVPFDPRLHEAMSTVRATSKAQDGRVVAVVKEGYMAGDEVLRPASVVVGKS